MIATRTFTSYEVCELAGITYRQLDYWCRIGLIGPSSRMAHGSGSRRRYTAHDVCVVAVVGKLAPFVRPTDQEVMVRHLAERHVLDWPELIVLDECGEIIENPAAADVGLGVRPRACLPAEVFASLVDELVVTR